MASLYIVSTPIGNLGDLSHRAVAVLREVDVILAEDTRRTGLLLRHFDIEGRLISAHEHNEAARARLVTELLGEGKDVALVSDAGTPLISDPGSRLVSAAIGAGFDVIPIPGASALLAALVVSGLPSDRFTFFGFIPRKGGDRQVFLREIAASAHSSVLYESPQRVGALLEDLCDLAGPERAVAVARELTKMHEECYRATLGEAVVHFRDRQVKGEIVVVVSPNPDPAAGPDEGAARALGEALLARGLSPSAIARELRDRLDIPRNDAYRLAQEIAGQTD